jgi:citrate synthase
MWIVIFAVVIVLSQWVAGRSLRRLEMLIDQVGPLCQHPDAQPAALAALSMAEKEHQLLKGSYHEDLIRRSDAAYAALQIAAQVAGATVLAGESVRRMLSKAKSQAKRLQHERILQPLLKNIPAEIMQAEQFIEERKFNDAADLLAGRCSAMDFWCRTLGDYLVAGYTETAKNSETAKEEFSAGLEGVVAFETALGQVFGEEGKLIYRGVDACHLAVNESMESVWLLLRDGKLPDLSTLRAFKEQVEKAGALSKDEIKIVKQLRGSQPLSAVRTAISAVANKRGYKPWLNRDFTEVDAEIMALTAITPSVVEILHTGKAPIAKPGNIGYAERYLWGILGTKPTVQQTSAIETYMILTMDHGSNASTFSGRVTVSTGADVGAALSAATATLSGPLHGGAPGPVLDMLEAIGTKKNAEPWVKEQLDKGRKLMGFGHRVYRTEDPRARTLRNVAERLDSPRTELARTVELTILAALEERQKAKATRLGTGVRTLRVNVEFWTAVVLDHVGIPRSLFSSTFCASRMIGWGEQIREQIRNNKLYRPLSRYIEPAPVLPAVEIAVVPLNSGAHRALNGRRKLRDSCLL